MFCWYEHIYFTLIFLLQKFHIGQALEIKTVIVVDRISTSVFACGRMLTDVEGRSTCLIRCECVYRFQNHYPVRWACMASSSPSPPAQSFPFPRLCCGARVGTRTPRCRRRSSPPEHWWWCGDGPCIPAGKQRERKGLKRYCVSEVTDQHVTWIYRNPLQNLKSENKLCFYFKEKSRNKKGVSKKV